jgi:phage shock protein C
VSSAIRRLYRSRTERMLGGVCGGLGVYFTIDPTLVRVLFVVLALGSGAGLIAYLLLLIIVPIEPLPPSSSPPGA